MSVITVTKARENIYKLIESVNVESEPIIITNTKADGKNAVLLSEDDWKAIQETLYLNSVPGLVNNILESASEPLESCTKYHEDEEW